MIRPTVTEIPRVMQAVERDDFADAVDRHAVGGAVPGKGDGKVAEDASTRLAGE